MMLLKHILIQLINLKSQYLLSFYICFGLHPPIGKYLALNHLSVSLLTV